ncbi:DUF3298 and DUF4163 domain-containing protein [Anaerolentibacter hominis]|uniref:DUF3298 and DUF4163 domain-containing protein n=1 Tax=Anaerolentibacter hominis TaxID=3079009 RepID=UPI0031B8741C
MKKDSLDDAKEEYNNITMPEDLLHQVKSTISRAREDMVREKRKRWFTGFKTAGVCAASFLLVLTVLANSSPQIARAFDKVPVLNAITRVVTFREYKFQDENTEANIATPQISGTGSPEAETKINQDISDYTEQIKAEYEAELEKNGAVHQAVDTDYQVLTDNSRFFSMVVQTELSAGSSDQFNRFYTIDKSNGNKVELKDLFKQGEDYITLLSEEIKGQMKKQMAENNDVYYFLEGEEEATDVFTRIKEDQNFYVNKDGNLVIAFDKYEVAPGSMGAVEFVIPFSLVTP